MTTIGEALIEVRADTSRLDSDVRSGVARSTGGLTRSGSSIGRKFGLALGGAAGAAAFGGGALVKSAVQLEAQYGKTMNVLQATTRASGAEMRQLDALAKRMGADTVFSANDASTAMLELARGGMKAATIQGGALEGTMTLAAAGELGMADAANVAVKAMGQFNLRGKDMQSVAAALAGGANASSASVSDMAQALAQGGLAANSVGFSVQETTGILAAFSRAGLEGSDAGTSLKTALDRLQPTTDKAATAFEKLGVITEDGRNRFIKANGEFESAARIAEVLRQGTEKLDAAERKRLITQAFGSDAQRAATILAEEGAEGIGKLVKATSDQGAAQRMAKANMKGTAGAIEQLKGAAETATLTLGQALAPSIRDLAKWTANEALPKLQDFADWMKEDGADNLRSFANGATDVASAIGDIVKFLADLPAPAKLAGLAAAVGGVGALKLRSGSGVTGAIGTAVGLTRPVPVFVTNPGFGGPGGTAPGGSRLGNAARNVGRAVLPAAALAAAGGITHHYASQDTPTNPLSGRKVTGGAEDYGYAATQLNAATNDMRSSFGSMVSEAISSAGQITAAFAGLPKELRTEFRTEGVPQTLQETQNVLSRYNLTPKEKRTLFAAVGSDQAKAQARALQTQYSLTPKEKRTLFELTGYSTLMSQIANINSSLDLASRDRRTQITVAYASTGRDTIGGLQSGNAEGTSNFRGGWSWVGEQGPELLRLPRGSQVIPATRSRVMAQAAERGSGGGRLRVVEGKLTIDERGQAWFRGIAAEEVADAADFAGTIGRMQ